MKKMNIEKEQKKERYILAAVGDGDHDEAERSLRELAALLETAKGEAVAFCVQLLDHPNPSTYVGRGKAEELAELAAMQQADGILFDDELSPAQIRNLSDIMDIKILDRTMLILDIFALHARTNEGKIQVEMAQLKYRISHLAGVGKAMSRLGGGIGTRGPGETKLETDRRSIGKRISRLSAEIKAMKQIRETTRKQRSASALPTAAIVGYTNAGKSTLLNQITNAQVLAEDKLFATLDPTTRKCRLPGGQEILLTDTVGFINKLPHHLIDAFRSTLEEAKYADMILHVIDASDPDEQLHQKVVYDTLNELGISGKPTITVWNKIDIKPADAILWDPTGNPQVKLSAMNGTGIDALFAAMEQLLRESRTLVDVVLPYSDSRRVSLMRKYGEVILCEYLEEGIHLVGYMPGSFAIEQEDRI